MIQIGGVYTTFGQARRAYFGKSNAIEMGGVSRYFWKYQGQGRFDSPDSLISASLHPLPKKPSKIPLQGVA